MTEGLRKAGQAEGHTPTSTPYIIPVSEQVGVDFVDEHIYNRSTLLIGLRTVQTMECIRALRLSAVR